jgi:hypothetical protein
LGEVGPMRRRIFSGQLSRTFGMPTDRVFGNVGGIRDVQELRHFVWVKLGFLVEQTSGRRFSHQSSPFLERSSAAPCGTDIVYIKLIVIGLCGRMRGSAVECGTRKITFRVRCIQPGSATSPLGYNDLRDALETLFLPLAATGRCDGTCALGTAQHCRLPVFHAEMCIRLIIRAVRRPSISPAACKCTSATTSLLAKVWRLQCQV